jgi:hypothetical protein
MLGERMVITELGPHQLLARGIRREHAQAEVAIERADDRVGRRIDDAEHAVIARDRQIDPIAAKPHELGRDIEQARDPLGQEQDERWQLRDADRDGRERLGPAPHGAGLAR